MNRLVHELPGVHIHIHVEILQPGAGDPLELVRKAIRRIAHLERRRSPFVRTVILLDPGSREKNREAQRLADENGIHHLIWQDPDHEGFLLRHLPGCQQRRLPAGASLAALQGEWPSYKKALTQIQLAGRLNFGCVQRARQVEAELDRFLRAIGIDT